MLLGPVTDEKRSDAERIGRPAAGGNLFGALPGVLIVGLLFALIGCSGPPMMMMLLMSTARRLLSTIAIISWWALQIPPALVWLSLAPCLMAGIASRLTLPLSAGVWSKCLARRTLAWSRSGITHRPKTTLEAGTDTPAEFSL